MIFQHYKIYYIIYMSRFSCLVNTNDDDNKFSRFPNTDAYLSGVIDGILASSEENSNKEYNVTSMPTSNYASVTTRSTEKFTEHMTDTSMPTSMPSYMPTSIPSYMPTSMPTTMPPFMPTTMPSYMPTTMPPTMPTTMPPTMSPFMPAAAMSTTMPPTMLPTTTPLVIKPTSPHEMKMKSSMANKDDSKDSDIAPFPINYTISIVVLSILIIFLLSFMYISKKP